VTPWDRYIAGVVSGELVVGELVRRAVARHQDDLEHGGARGLHFDADEAHRAVGFFELCKQTKGRFAGQPLHLEDWQAFIVASLFGWKRADGFRRFRLAYIEVAKKNGKSTLAGGLALKFLVADGEPGAEVYAAATSREQARIVYEAAEQMAKRSGPISRRVTTYRHSLVVPGTASRMLPLSADAGLVDGLNIHAAIADELHWWADQTFFEVIEQSMAARSQPMLVGITTAGEELEGVCGRLHDYTDQVVRGAVQDDALFGYIASLDEGDDWTSPATWVKANPNLGVSIDLAELTEKITRAQQEPARQNGVRRLRLNQWVAASVRYIDLDTWDAGAGELRPLELEAACAGRRCYAGLDLAKSIDLTALVLVFPPEDDSGVMDVVCRFWMPEEIARSPEKQRRDRQPYGAYADAGLLRLTPGNTTDYHFVRRELVELAGRFEIQQVGYDRMFAAELVQDLQEQDGLALVPIGQGFISMAAPTLELDSLVRGRRLRHGGHPILRWHADNLVVVEDDAGNRKPSRKKSRQKIDGMVALVMALDRALRNEGSPDSTSIYGAGAGLALL